MPINGVRCLLVPTFNLKNEAVPVLFIVVDVALEILKPTSDSLKSSGIVANNFDLPFGVPEKISILPGIVFDIGFLAISLVIVFLGIVAKSPGAIIIGVIAFKNVRLDNFIPTGSPHLRWAFLASTALWV